MAESVVFTGLIVTVLLYTCPEPLVPEMVTYVPFITSTGSLLHVMMTSNPVFTAESTVAVHVMTSSVPWYTVSSVLRETDTSGAGTA